MKNNNIISILKKKLVVSCQALEDEPLHSPFIMGRMAVAAKEGGACGIRANSVNDIIEIKKNVNIPVIGIIKNEYLNSDIYITPTLKEIDDLMEVGVDIIAIDATSRIRPNGLSLNDFFKKIKEKYPTQIFMADISTIEEAKNAENIGFDFIGTTLYGYTEYTLGCDISDNDFEFLNKILKSVSIPVIAEGKIDTPEKAKRVLEIGAFCVVVGSAITRPQLITKSFTNKIKNLK